MCSYVFGTCVNVLPSPRNQNSRRVNPFAVCTDGGHDVFAGTTFDDGLAGMVLFVVKLQEHFFLVHEPLEECKGAVPCTRQYKRSGGAVDMKPLKVLAGVQKPSRWHVTDTEAVCLPEKTVMLLQPLLRLRVFLFASSFWVVVHLISFQREQ